MTVSYRKIIDLPTAAGTNKPRTAMRYCQKKGGTRVSSLNDPIASADRCSRASAFISRYAYANISYTRVNVYHKRPGEMRKSAMERYSRAIRLPSRYYALFAFSISSPHLAEREKEKWRKRKKEGEEEKGPDGDKRKNEREAKPKRNQRDGSVDWKPEGREIKTNSFDTWLIIC